MTVSADNFASPAFASLQHGSPRNDEWRKIRRETPCAPCLKMDCRDGPGNDVSVIKRKKKNALLRAACFMK
jgi:hypothetical protein